MKDPLHTEQTAYEILDVQPGATEEDIHTAFKNGVVHRKNIQKLTAARNMLKRPEQRAMLDLFYYSPGALKKLNPNPLENPDILDPANRLETGNLWEKQLKEAFPDVGVTHTLAVFWYWWAIHEEMRLSEILKSASLKEEETNLSSKEDLLRRIMQQENIVCDPAGARSCKVPECRWRSDCLPATPPVEEMWNRVIANWGTLMSNPGGWDALTDIPGPSRNTLKESIEKKLRNHLFGFAAKYRDNGTSRLSESFQNLDLALTMELRTASEIGSIGIRTGKGKIVCGRLMLEYTGLLGLVSNTVEAQLRKRPDNAKLTRLLDALSPFYQVAVLIDSNKPGEALNALGNLPGENRNDPRAVRLEVRALMERGKQHVSVGRLDEGLQDWCVALDIARKNDLGDLKSKIEGNIVSTCKEKSAAISNNRRDEAIRILEKGISYVKNEDLQLSLADLLTQRAIERINSAQKKLMDEAGAKVDDAMAEFDKGLKELKRAAKMGFQRAADQLKIAANLFDQAKAAQKAASLPQNIQDSLKEANEAASAQDWEKAISSLRIAIAGIGARSSDELNKMLAQCLAMRGIKSRNEAFDIYNKTASDRQKKGIKWLFARRFLISKFGKILGCELCCKPIGIFDRHYTANKPNGDTARLCEKCATTLEHTAKGASYPGRKVVFLLDRAYRDMKEASELDPGNADLKKVFGDLRSAFSSLGVTEPKSRPKRLFQTSSGNPFRRNILHTTLLMAIYVAGLCAFFLYGVPDIGHYLSTKGFFGKIVSWIGIVCGLFLLLQSPFLVAEIWVSLARKRWQYKGSFGKLSEIIAYLGLIIVLVYAGKSIEISKIKMPDWINSAISLQDVFKFGKSQKADERTASQVVLPAPTKVIPGGWPNQDDANSQRATPAVVPAPSPVVSKSGSQQLKSKPKPALPAEITVKKGDKLDQIARAWYPDDVKRGIGAIKAANPQLGKKGVLRPGEILKLPVLDTKP